MGAVFMDKKIIKISVIVDSFSASGAARQEIIACDVNYYDRQDYFDKHRYVVIETP